MRINNNIQALNAYRNLSSNQFNTSKNLERLSSGLRINRAADDAAGLAISEKMRAQIRGLQMAERNSLDGISLIQTAEGALTEVHSMLHRMRELAVQAANDTNTEGDRKEIQKEVDQLTSEINRIGNATEFNTKKLLNGGATKIAPNVNKYGVALANGEVTSKVITESVKTEAFNAKVTTPSDAGTPTAGVYEFELTDEFIDQLKAGDKISVGGVEFTAVSGVADPTAKEFSIQNTDANTILLSLKAAIDDTGSGLSTDYSTSVTTNKLTLTENTASGTDLNDVNIKETLGEYSFEISKMFIPGEQIEIGGEKFTFVAAGADITKGQINIGSTPAEQASNIKAAFDGNTEITDRFNVSVVDNKLILKEKTGEATGVAPEIDRVGNAEGTVHFNELVKGEAGVNAKYEIDITNAFRENETIEIGGVTFKGVKGAPNPAATPPEFSVDGNASDQANNLQQALAANTTLSNAYTITKTGTKIILEAKAAGPDTLTKPKTDLIAAIPGEFSFNIERSTVGQSFTIDGIEIKVVNDSTQFNDDVNTGKAMRHSESLSVQAENLRKAIERNPELGKKYFVEGTGNEVILKQRPGYESSILPDIMLSNTGDGDVFKSNLQIGPNQHQILTVELNDIRSPKLGISTTDPRTKIVDMNGDLIEGAAFNVIKNISNGVNEGFVEYSIDVSSHEKASAAIKVFDTAIERVNGERASLGALQNRLEHTINNLKVTHENLSSSESRIRDADMALEMTAFTKNNILNQSAQAMLAQANQLPQGVLQLLQG